MRAVRIGTRSSDLALYQTGLVADKLRTCHPEKELRIDIVPIRTLGDQTQKDDTAMPAQPGFFVKEIERALIDDEIDLAVHSLKDLPSSQPAGLCIGAVLEREVCNDVICANSNQALLEIYEGLTVGKAPSRSWTIGTSSPRRQAAIRNLCQLLKPQPIRGNLDTRLRKMNTGQFDAILLAAAGIKRLGLKVDHLRELPTDKFIPASGQAAVAVQCRQGDLKMRDCVQPINHLATWQQMQAEQSFMRRLGATCLTPVGVLARTDGTTLKVDAVLYSQDDGEKISAALEGDVDEAEQLGINLAERLFELGAKQILSAG